MTVPIWNLNDLEINLDGNCTTEQDDNSFKKGNIEVFFKDLDKALVIKIKEADAVLGCTAWLTHPDILEALAALEYGASIIVQKEDFLRPDVGSYYEQRLREQYHKIRPIAPTASATWSNNWEGIRWVETNTIASELCVAGWPDEKTAIRCVGNHNKDKYPANPRMHNKFMVFGKVEQNEKWLWRDDVAKSVFFPYAVWTGSFNPTINGGRSLENAIYIYDDMIAKRYLKEWGQILALSEPLDWESEWACPTLRIGT